MGALTLPARNGAHEGIVPGRRSFASTTSVREDNPMTAERDSMEYDMVVVGAGPAGLAAAIRAKQVAEEKGQELSVCVLEKGHGEWKVSF